MKKKHGQRNYAARVLYTVLMKYIYRVSLNHL